MRAHRSQSKMNPAISTPETDNGSKARDPSDNVGLGVAERRGGAAATGCPPGDNSSITAAAGKRSSSGERWET